MVENGRERRQHRRLDNNVPLKITSTDANFSTNTVNISRSGVYCTVDKYVEPMTKLKINLMVPVKKNNKFISKKIKCEGIVVRSEKCEGSPMHNVAIFFNDITQQDAEDIADYVGSYDDQQKQS
jgi:hypothetical protein